MKASAAAVTSRLLTLEEWAELDEDEEGELVDGVLEEEEMPTFLHELAVMWVAALLRTWARARRGFVTGSETKVAIAERRGRKPDVVVFMGAARPKLLDALVRVAPHLVVEVISKRPRDARRDRVDKLADYARAGVKYYWILDPQLRTLEIYERDARGRYVHALGATSGRLGRVPGCPGLRFDLDELWNEIDEAARMENVRRPRQRR